MTSLPDFPPAQICDLGGHGALSVHVAEGKGPTLLLLHGFTDCAQSFRLLLPHLRGRRVVMPDLRGHGASRRGGRMSFDLMVRDIERLLAHVHGGCAVEIAGHSMGSILALRVVLGGRVPVSRVTLISGSLQPRGAWLDELSRMVAQFPRPLAPDDPFFEQWHRCERPVPRPFLDLLAQSASTMPRQVWLDCIAMLQAEDLRAVSPDTLPEVTLISGGRDPIFGTRHQLALRRRLPSARIRDFPDLGHNPHWEEPAQIAALL